MCMCVYYMSVPMFVVYAYMCLWVHMSAFAEIKKSQGYSSVTFCLIPLRWGDLSLNLEFAFCQPGW